VGDVAWLCVYVFGKRVLTSCEQARDDGFAIGMMTVVLLQLAGVDRGFIL